MNTQYVEEKVKAHEETLYGKDGKMGLAHKVAVLWSAHVWVLCALSAGLGFVARPWVQNFLK